MNLRRAYVCGADEYSTENIHDLLLWGYIRSPRPPTVLRLHCCYINNGWIHISWSAIHYIQAFFVWIPAEFFKFLLCARSLVTTEHSMCFLINSQREESGSATRERDLPHRIKAILDISVLCRLLCIPHPTSTHTSRPSGMFSGDWELRINA